MTTSRAIKDDLTNIFDRLVALELLLNVNEISVENNRRSGTRRFDKVSWQATGSGKFLPNRDRPTVADYRFWVEQNSYSAMMFDASLIQATFKIENGEVCEHRLAYVPAPYDFGRELIATEPIVDLLDYYSSTEPDKLILHSTIRFDFDIEAAKPGHPAAHLTINSPSCRIACTGPMHFGRFIDFIFRHFYPALWYANIDFFAAYSKRELGKSVLDVEDSYAPHIAWRERVS